MQAVAGIGPPVYSAAPMWHGFWIASVVILIVVAFVGTIIALVNRVERQAAETVLHLSAGKDASRPFEDLVEVNIHLRAVAVSAPAATRRPRRRPARAATGV